MFPWWFSRGRSNVVSTIEMTTLSTRSRGDEWGWWRLIREIFGTVQLRGDESFLGKNPILRWKWIGVGHDLGDNPILGWKWFVAESDLGLKTSINMVKVFEKQDEPIKTRWKRIWEALYTILPQTLAEEMEGAAQGLKKLMII